MVFRLVTTLGKAVFSRQPQERFDARYSLLNSLSNRLHFQLYNGYLSWSEDQDYLRVWQKFPQADRNIKDRKYVLYSMAKSLATLAGDSAECGVFTGGSSYLICAAMKDKQNYAHHVFDSFEGLSEPEVIDTPSDHRAYEWKQHDLSIPIEVVENNLSQFNFVHYYKGWIPDRFYEVSDRKFAFVHIDVDLYQPTRDSIAFFYDRMVPGGIILCDDYGFSTCPGATRAMDEFVQDKPEHSVIHLTTGQGFIIKR